MNGKIEYAKRLEKIVISGNVVEYYRFANPIPVEHRDYDIIKNIETYSGRREDNIYRARLAIRRVIWCNMTEHSKFITLTYKECNLSYEQLNNDFKRFIRRLRAKGFNCPYLWISEHQKQRGLKENNAGSLHIHCVLFSDDFIHFSIIRDCWGLGGVDIHSVRSINNIGAYVCKYLSKEEFNEYHLHSYHISRGLNKPYIFNHDGYMGRYIIHEDDNLLQNVDFCYSDTRQFSYTAADGSIVHNSIIYQQGVINNAKKSNKFGINVKDSCDCSG